jgi:hypothetical protein
MSTNERIALLETLTAECDRSEANELTYAP